jgi:NADH-quinone oxidoreductase subunit L
MAIPLIVLAILSIVGGFVELPETLGNLPLFSNFMQNVFPGESVKHAGAASELMLQIIASAASLAGVFIAYALFIGRPQYAESLSRTPAGSVLERFWFSGWGFDWLYDILFVRPFIWLIQINRDDFIDLIYTGIAAISRILHAVLSATQTGNIRWYAMGIAAGAVVFLGIVVFFH